MFFQFTINSQSKLKKFSTLLLRHLPTKTSYKTSQGFMVGSFSLRPQKFFFSYCRVFSLKSKKKKELLKKDASHLSVPQKIKRQKKEKKEKEKRKVKKSQTTTINISLLLLCIEKLIFCQKHILKNLVYIVTFVLQFFHVKGY